MMPSRNSVRALVGILLLASGSAWAQTADAVYLYGRVKELPEKKAGSLDASDPEVLQFTWLNRVWKVPFAEIKTIYVSLSRRSVLVEAFGLAGAAVGEAKKRKLLLSLSLTDREGKNRNCVFFLPTAPRSDFWEILEAKTGRRAIYESEEARRAATGEE